jgi:hypothetical protein
VRGTADASPAKHGWPIEPTNKEHPLGNSNGEFQDYGNAYQHPGIDILATPKLKADGKEDTSAPWAIVTVGGKIASLYDKQADKTQNGTEITATDGATYSYWHFQENSYHKDFVLNYNNKKAVAAGDKIAKLTRFPKEFHHLHYDLAKGGKYLDPLAEITPNPDPQAPEIAGIGLAKASSNPWSEFKPVAEGGCIVVSGKADVIAQIRDQDDAGSKLVGADTLWVKKIRWRACPESNPTCTWQEHCDYSDMLTSWRTEGNDVTAAFFSNRTPWDSDSDYGKATWLYGVVSKYVPAFSSGLGAPKPEGEWDTTTLSDGSYSVSVEATDFVSNTTVYSVLACVQNGPGCTTELMIRDASDDKGGIPYPGKNWWVSPDITANPGTADQDKNINIGVANPIEVQVWNNGSCKLAAGTAYTVCLGWGLPSASVAYPLPAKQLINCQPETVPAGDWAVGKSRVTKFTWTPKAGSVPQGHHCLVAWVDMDKDVVQNTAAVNWDDNRAQQNITFAPAPKPPTPGSSSFWVNPQEAIEDRCLELSFQPVELWPVLQRIRLLIGAGLRFDEVVGGDPTGGDHGYELAVVGIDPSRPFRMCGIRVQQPVPLMLELLFAEELAEGQFIEAQVVETGLLPGHPQATALGGLTLRFEPGRPGLRLMLGSGLLADLRVREALLYAVPWQELLAEVDAPLGVFVWGAELVADDVREWPYDPGRSEELLAEAGYDPGMPIALIVPPEDEPLLEMARWMADTLGGVGLTVDLFEVPVPEATAVLAQMMAAGEPAMLLER